MKIFSSSTLVFYLVVLLMLLLRSILADPLLKGRNPFALPGLSRSGHVSDKELIIRGIIVHDETSASILDDGTRTWVVKPGDKCCDAAIKSVDPDGVILLQGDEEIRIPRK